MNKVPVKDRTLYMCQYATHKTRLLAALRWVNVDSDTVYTHNTAKFSQDTEHTLECQMQVVKPTACCLFSLCDIPL